MCTVIISVLVYFHYQSVSNTQNLHETDSEVEAQLKKIPNINNMVDYCNSLHVSDSRRNCFNTVWLLAGALFAPPNYHLALLDDYPLLDKSIDITLENRRIMCSDIEEGYKTETYPRDLCSGL